MTLDKANLGDRRLAGATLGLLPALVGCPVACKKESK